MWASRHVCVVDMRGVSASTDRKISSPYNAHDPPLHISLSGKSQHIPTDSVSGDKNLDPGNTMRRARLSGFHTTPPCCKARVCG